MKLYSVDVMNDCEIENFLVVAQSKEEALEKVDNMEWSCYMNSWVCEINEIDGYKVVFKKGKKIALEI